jgi:hypothetical protein
MQGIWAVLKPNARQPLGWRGSQVTKKWVQAKQSGCFESGLILRDVILSNVLSAAIMNKKDFNQ